MHGLNSTGFPCVVSSLDTQSSTYEAFMGWNFLKFPLHLSCSVFDSLFSFPLNVVLYVYRTNAEAKYPIEHLQRGNNMEEELKMT